MPRARRERSNMCIYTAHKQWGLMSACLVPCLLDLLPCPCLSDGSCQGLPPGLGYCLQSHSYWQPCALD